MTAYYNEFDPDRVYGVPPVRVDLPKTPLQWRTAPEVEIALRQAIAKGMTAAMAADYIRVQTGYAVTRNACIGRSHRLGLKFRGRLSDKGKANGL